MMNILRPVRVALLCMPMLFSSCICDEEANTECDIERATLRVADAGNFFFHLYDTVQVVKSDADTIKFDVRDGVDLSALAPEFSITRGAQITPASGSVHDFRNGGVEYVVRSENGAYSRHYKVMFIPHATETHPDTIEFNFESAELEPKKQAYYQWIEHNGVFESDCWVTGNPGFRLSKSSALPEDYPTVPLQQGVNGHGVKLETRSTLPFGAMVNMRLAAGNLFIGQFNVDEALKDAMAATLFGKPLVKCPVKLTGYYQYTSGDVYQNRAGKTVADSVDKPDIYAVFYRNSDAEGKAVVLHGDDVLTNENIVAVARVRQLGATSGSWVRFETDFDYKAAVDPEVLKERGYSFTLVASSSRDGAKFCGAVGSTLLIDEFRLICKNAIHGK